MHRRRVLWYCGNLGYGFLSIEHEGEKMSEVPVIDRDLPESSTEVC
jgi:hypothetical protein